MYELVSFVLSGKVRYEILRRLDKPKMPTALSKEIGTHQSTISRAILTLSGKGLIKCLTPSSKLYRLYQITQKGKEILKKIKEIK
jgi:DNA-binding MarR family transcriptional regulator